MPNIIEITDLQNPLLDPYARLTENQLRSRRNPDKGIFIAESKTVVSLALDAGYTPLSMLMERGQLLGGAKDLADRCGDIPIYTADNGILEQLTGFSLSRGVLAVMRRPVLPTVEEVCRNARRLAVLENIMDAANVGAIIRSAAALGMDAVLVTPRCSDPLLRRAARVSMGTVFQIPWSFLPTNENYVSVLQEYGFKTAAMALTDNSVSIDNERVAKEERLAIILGTEGEGLKQSTIDSSDYTVKIPMSHGVDSLNVAAASAVAFWQLGRR